MEQRRMLSVVAAISLLASLASCGASHTHDLMLVDRLEPTCVSDGHDAYYQCQVPTCMEIFKDPEAKEPTTLEAVKLPATGIHKGGHADCQHRAVCEVCGQEYGELGSHVYDKTVASDAYLSSAATCTEAATYFYSCVCGEKGTETFTNGDPLGHDYQATDTADVFRCSRCNVYKTIFDFENADSNAWNVEGAEYRDDLWKIAGPAVGQHGSFVIGHLNQVIEEQNLPGKVYLAFTLASLEAVTAKLSIAMLMGSSSVSKSVFKLEVNGKEVVAPGEFAGQYADYNHVELFDYTDISLKEGFNTLKFTIMDSPKSNVDYITLESKEWVNEHHFAYDHDENGHWLKCTDEGCTATCCHEAHAFEQEVKEAQYLKTKATCTTTAVYYKSCVCGLAGSETFGGESSGENHTFDQEVVDEKYLASPATCTEPAFYYYSCVCGEKGSKTFSYGKALGHDYQSIDGNYLNQKCSRCDSYRHLVEFESMKSNAWNEEGAEYRDQLWKCTGDTAKVSNGWSVKHINDNAVAQPGKIYLETSISMLEETTMELSLSLALGGSAIARSAWGISLNGAAVNVGEGTLNSTRTASGNDWDDDTYRLYDLVSLTLVPGVNTLRFTINSGCSCNADYLALDGSLLADKHTLKMAHDDSGHWYECTDEGCGEKSAVSAHVYDQAIVSDEFKKEDGVYYYSCICGAKGTATFEGHIHSFAQQESGKNDVLTCACGAMKRKFDLATSYSESWSEGTAKTDKLWRLLNHGTTGLDSGNAIGHINDVTTDGGHDGEYWIDVAVGFAGDVDQNVDLIFHAGVSSGSWDNIIVMLNGTTITPAATAMSANGWENYTDYDFGQITLKANVTNVIRVSPKQGCSMNWAYWEIDSAVPTSNLTSTLPLA